MRRTTTQRPKAQRPRSARPIAIVALTAVTCGCAVAVANGQVSVPGVKTPQVNVPQVNVPQLQKNLPQVPSTPQVSVPEVSLPKTQVQVPSTDGVVPKVQVPSVKLPSTGVPGVGSRGGSGGGGGSTGAGSSPGSGTGTAASGAGTTAQGGSAGTAATATAAVLRQSAQGRAVLRQRSARHERSLRRAARQLEGCLPALSSFDRQVIVLRGGLHGRDPLSRGGTAKRLDVSTGRVRSAEHSGLAGLRKANAQTGCGLFSGAGRNVAARRLAAGSAPALSPLAVAGASPALVAKDSLPTDRGEVKGAQASSHRETSKTPSRAGILPTSGGEGSTSAGVWVAILGALALGAAALLVVVRRRAADPYGYSNRSEAVYPHAWETQDWDWGPSEEDQGAWPQVEEASAVAIEAPPAEPAPPVEQPAEASPEVVQQPEAPARRRRDRTTQAFGGLAASGAAISLLLGRFVGRRRRR